MILPRELIRVRRTKTALTPLFADKDKLSLAKTIITIYQENKDRKRQELNEGLKGCEELGYDFKLVRGISAVLDHHSSFGAHSAIPPSKARRMLFEEASRNQYISEKNRSAIINKVAEKLGVSSTEIEESLYADLLDEQRLLEFREPTPEELLQLYNLSLISMVLAYSVHISISYSAANKRLEEAAKALGKPNFKVGALSLDLKPSKQFVVRGMKIEKLLARLIESKEWSLHSDVAYPPALKKQGHWK